MEAGRELDAKVAEALGWVVKGYWVFNRKDETVGRLDETLQFSTTWEGMGVLVKEAKKQGPHIDIMTWPSDYTAQVFDAGDSTKLVATATSKEAPHAVCLAFLKAKGITI
ncbi:hypothetical protein ACPT9H_00295 [Brevibacillus borstelensis]|uniref:hypothetical protein n=1 Tax=Brevibacillus borstelensis TaxID=45462 RepID=UPI003CE45467